MGVTLIFYPGLTGSPKACLVLHYGRPTTPTLSPSRPRRTFIRVVRARAAPKKGIAL